MEKETKQQSSQIEERNQRKVALYILFFAFLLLITGEIIPSVIYMMISKFAAYFMFILSFNYLGFSNYKGTKEKLVFRVIRYIITAVVLVALIGNVMMFVTSPGLFDVHFFFAISSLLAYLVAYNPSDTTMGQKVMKVIGYTLMLLIINSAGLCKSHYHIDWSYIAVAAIFITIGFILLILVQPKISTQNETLSTSSTQSKIGKCILKVLLSCVLIFIPVLLTTYAIEDFHYDVTWIAPVFYIPLYLLFVTWYIYLIWRKKKSTGEDVMLLPVWRKMGMFKNVEKTSTSRKELFFFIAPLMIITLSCNIFSLYVKNIFLPILPMILWALFFIYGYAKGWLNKQDVTENKTIQSYDTTEIRAMINTKLVQSAEEAKWSNNGNDEFAKGLQVQVALATTLQRLKEDENSNKMRILGKTVGFDYDEILQEEFEKVYDKYFKN